MGWSHSLQASGAQGQAQGERDRLRRRVSAQKETQDGSRMTEQVPREPLCGQRD